MDETRLFILAVQEKPTILPYITSQAVIEGRMLHPIDDANAVATPRAEVPLDQASRA